MRVEEEEDKNLIRPVHLYSTDHPTFVSAGGPVLRTLYKPLHCLCIKVLQDKMCVFCIGCSSKKKSIFDISTCCQWFNSSTGCKFPSSQLVITILRHLKWIFKMSIIFPVDWEKITMFIFFLFVFFLQIILRLILIHNPIKKIANLKNCQSDSQTQRQRDTQMDITTYSRPNHNLNLNLKFWHPKSSFVSKSYIKFKSYCNVKQDFPIHHSAANL